MSSKNTKTDSGSAGGFSEKVSSLREYFEESKTEIKKVTWPSKKEVRVTTIAVLILVTFMSIFLGVIDLGLIKAVGLILGR